MRGKGLLAFVLLGVFLTAGFFVATAEEGAKDEVKYTLVGKKNCKMCHNKEKTGAQFAKWENRPPWTTTENTTMEIPAT